MAKKLSLNVAKSNVLAFRTKNRNDQPFLNLHINEKKLNEKTSAKYLGLIFYNKLLWYHHLDHVASKLTKSNGLLAKLRHFIPPTKFNMLYNALIQPHLDYGSLCWSSAAHSTLHHIEKLQNKSIRLLHFKKYQDPTPHCTKNQKFFPWNKTLYSTKQNLYGNSLKTNYPQVL